MGELEQEVQKAVNGDKKALEKVVISIQDFVYHLALRMRWHPEEAKDAAQEILIKVITHLSRFEHKSSFKTWVYRIASNELLNHQKRQVRHQQRLETFEQQLYENFSNTISYTSNPSEQSLLIQEAKVGCSHAMLQCLDDENRLVYIIGEILEFNSKEGAFILDITPASFRQKLSRTRKKLHPFIHRVCGIVNSKNTCRCRKKVEPSIQKGIINPNRLLFAGEQQQQLIEEIEEIRSEVSLFQSNPDYQAPEQLLKEVRRILEII